jgi:NitT/TauT family transport system permease protein
MNEFQYVGDIRQRPASRIIHGFRSIAYPVASFTIVVIVWKLIQVGFSMPSYILPSPEHVFYVAIEEREILFTNLLITLSEVMYGLGLAVALAVPLAVAMASWAPIERLMYPALVAFQGLPKSSLAPLFIVWLGFGILPKIVLVVVITFFAILVSIFVGLKSVHPDMIDMGRTMGLSRLGLLRRIELPSSLPSFFGGLKVGITLAIVGAIVAEFVGAQGGIGYLIIVASAQVRTDLIFAALLYVSVMGIIFFILIDGLERLLIPWHINRNLQLT